jgi:hypothetical protein
VAIGGVGFCDVAADGIVSGESVPADIVPDDRVSPVDGFPAVRDLAEEEGGPAVAVETCSGAAVEGCCAEATGTAATLGPAWRRRFQKASTNVTSSKTAASFPHGTRAEAASTRRTVETSAAATCSLP